MRSTWAGGLRNACISLEIRIIYGAPTFLYLPSIEPFGPNTVQVLYTLSPSRSGIEPAVEFINPITAAGLSKGNELKVRHPTTTVLRVKDRGDGDSS